MRLKKIEIIKYRNFENTIMDFEKSKFPSVFAIASKNGGGKSTLLQFVFIMLHCFMDDNKKQYMQNLLRSFADIDEDLELVKFIIEHDNEVYNLDFSIVKSKFESMDFILYPDIKKTETQRDKDKRFDSIANPDTLKEEKEAYNQLKMKLKLIDEKLTQSNLKYITHLKNNKNVILLKTEMPEELLVQLTSKIFLTAPNSQVFLFLSDEEKKKIFSKFDGENDLDKSYSNSIEQVKKILGNFITYDFASIELILQSFEQAMSEDAKEKRTTGKYGNTYDKLLSELKNFLDSKEISEDENANNIIVKSTKNGQVLLPEDLSHGELKKLGIYVWLKYIVKEDSIVLMDEVDIALHPKWQYDLVKDLIAWSNNSQFLLATHSPQILSSTYYKNIIKLDNGQAKRYNKPPLDRDINAIILEVMEADDFPQDLKKLHDEYRKLIEDGNIETVKAKNLKKEILEYESENSSFFQDINFDLALNS